MKTYLKDYLPNSTDKIFKEETNSKHGAWLQNPANKFFLYSEGYKEAGNRLYDFCIEKPFYWNTVIYPLVFNYRQFIELRLKELIIMGYKYLDQNKDFADEHSLTSLWNTYRNEILLELEEIEKETLDSVEKIINEFNSEDPKSMSFRYPVRRAPDRKPSINRETIDIKNFKVVIEKVIYFFDWQWDMVSHLLDLKDEMIADMYKDYY
jgi:hypothetical protein